MAVRLVLVVLMAASTQETRVQALLQPNLTVNLPLITETDSVTLSCQPPSSVSVSQCFFYTVKGGSQKSSSCLQTLTAAELLRISHRTSPATVEVKCFYTVEKGDVNSPYSDVSYISIGQKPQLSVQQYEGDVSFVCSLPGSVKPDATCHLYFGEARRPVQTSTVRENRSSKANLWFCQFSLSVDDIIRRLVQQKDASCDYSLKYELNSLSPRSDPRSLADYVKGVSNSAVTMTTAKSTVRKLRFSTSTASVNLKPGLTLSHHLTSAHATSGHTTSGSDNYNPTTDMRSATKTTGNVASGNNNTEITGMWRIKAAVAGGGITAAAILLVLTCLRVERGTETCSQMRKKGIFIDGGTYMADCDETYSIVTYECITE